MVDLILSLLGNPVMSQDVEDDCPYQTEPAEMEPQGHYGALVGDAEEMHELYRMIQAAAACDCEVVITGESGTGKKLVAREIHRASARADGPFVHVNVAAIPSELFEGTMFGHKKGSFTGAIRDTKGKFRAAHGGTLFLDEIAELSSDLQSKLLTAIEDRLIQTVGSDENESEALDVRIIVATSRNLEEAVQEGVIRGDLYYRFNVLQLNVPALRSRGDDVALLIRHFFEKWNEGRLSGVAKEIYSRQLRSYLWPGNVRELENLVRSAIALARPGSRLETQNLVGGASEEKFTGAKSFTEHSFGGRPRKDGRCHEACGERTASESLGCMQRKPCPYGPEAWNVSNDHLQAPVRSRPRGFSLSRHVSCRQKE